MDRLKIVTENFVTQSKEILGDNLVGIYLHGSAVMGCFNEKTSDIDLLVVIHRDMSEEEKHRYMDMVVELNTLAPAKGIEMSIIKKSVCKPFVYPTPFELHFSVAHLEWYKNTPQDYVLKMNGTDKDLAAHITILYHRGQCLFGENIHDVFEPVEEKEYFDSIWYDIENAKEDILENPVYVILNLCRVLAFKKEKLILSKQEGGVWELAHVPETYHSLIQQALDEYISVGSMKLNEEVAVEFATYMLEQINTVKIEKLAVHDLHRLTELFEYNNVEQMIAECTRDIQNGRIDIYVLYEKDVLIGELHVMYENDDENFAVRDRRAYLFAFRVRKEYRNKGYGAYLLKTVLTRLKEDGYYEFTVGVEDDNFRAIHMYQAQGFTELLLRKQEEYQGDSYEYNLYLKRKSDTYF